MKEINLIGYQTKKFFGFDRQAKLLKNLILALDVVLVLVMAGFFALYLKTNREMKVSREKIQALKSEIAKLRENESYLLTINNRILEIESFLKSRVSETELFSEAKTLFVPGLTVSSIELGGSKTSVISGVCPDLQCLSNLNERLEDLKQKKTFSVLTFENMSRKAKEPIDVKISFQK